jgi:chemotaxis signal transduction protein
VTVSWLQFDLGERAYAIPLDAVAEVMPARRPRLIPLVPMEVGGILNLRGEPLVVVDGGPLFGHGSDLRYRHVLLLEQGSLRIGLRVGQVSRIDRDLAVVRGGEEDVDQEYPFVRWVKQPDGTLGLVDLFGFLERATALLTQSRAHQGGQEKCQSGF